MVVDSFMAQLEFVPLVEVPVGMLWVESRLESVNTLLPYSSLVNPF